MSVVLVYEFMPVSSVAQPANMVSILFHEPLYFSFFTNAFSDYLSLFVVRKLLTLGRTKPLSAALIGPAFGIGAVASLVLGRDLIVMHFWNLGLESLLVFLWDELHSYLFIWAGTYKGLALAALLVHLWLPLFALCISLLKVVNYLRGAVGWTQWFIKHGRYHPLDAVGYVAAVIVFGTAVLLRWISRILGVPDRPDE
jgi:hypothetical protein